MIISGVPLGEQTDVLACSTTGDPADVTRVAPVDHCAVTQGGEPDVMAGQVQPATLYGAAMVTMGMPITVTWELTAVGWATPT